MAQERWRRTEELFNAALDLTQEKRAAFLERNCGTDRELRREIEVLLSKEKEAGSFLETAVIADSRLASRPQGRHYQAPPSRLRHDTDENGPARGHFLGDYALDNTDGSTEG